MAKLDKQKAVNWTTMIMVPVLVYMVQDLWRTVKKMDTTIQITDVNAKNIDRVDNELKRHKKVIFPIVKENMAKTGKNLAEIVGLKNSKIISELNRKDITTLQKLHLK